MINKRDFFKFLAVAPIAAPMTAVAMAREGDEPEAHEVNITLHGLSPPRKVDTNYPHIGGMSFNLMQEDPNRRVTMSVGKDGNFWIKTVQGGWKRVVTE